MTDAPDSDDYAGELTLKLWTEDDIAGVGIIFEDDDIFEDLWLYYEYDAENDVVRHNGEWMPQLVRIFLEEYGVAAWDSPDTDDGEVIP